MMNLIDQIFPKYFSRFDRVSVVFGALVSISAIITMLRISPTQVGRNNKVIAELVSQSNNVRYRGAGAVSFYEANLNEKLQNDDEIFTGSDSHAVVHFIKSKVILKIPSSSLIRIEDDENGGAIEVKDGQVDIILEKNQSLNIKTGGEKRQIVSSAKRTSVKLYNSKGKTELYTNDTGLKLKNNSGAFTTVIPGSELKVVESKSNNKATFNIISPKAGDTVDLLLGMDIKLDKKGSYSVEISKSADFVKNIFSAEFVGSTYKLKSFLEEGDYYLKVGGKDDSKNIPFKNYSQSKIRDYSPEDGSFVTIGPGEEVRLNWNNNSLKSFSVIVRDDKGQQTHYSTVKNELILNNIRGSSFEWGVYPEMDKNNFSNIKLPNRVGVVFKGEIPISKSDRSVFKVNEKNLDIKVGERKDDSNIVNISDVDTNTEILNKKINDSKFSLPVNKIGKYKVVVSSENYPSLKSAEFSYEVVTPVIDWDSSLPGEINSSDEKVKTSLKYKANVENVKNLTVLMTYTPVSGSSVQNKIKAEQLGELELNGYGKYCFVAQPDASTKYIHESTPYCMKVNEVPEYSVLEKVKDTVLVFANNGDQESYVIEVPEVSKARGYQFEIYRDRMGKSLVYSVKTEKPSTEWNTKRAGLYFMRYRVIDSKGRSSKFSPLSKIIFPISPLTDWMIDE